MELQRLINTRQSVRLVMLAVRMMPAICCRYVADSLARFFARCGSTPMVKAVRDNQLLVRGKETPAIVIGEAVSDVFAHAGRCFIDLYKTIQNPRSMERLFPETSSLRNIIHWSRNEDFGALLVVPHMSNFDLCLLSAAHRGFKTQVLVYGKPPGGYRLQNDIRSSTGLEITPVNRDVYNNTLEKLRSGGFVTTAIDRPIREKRRKLNFFGSPCPLPVGHIRMALEADVPIIVGSVHMDRNGRYRLQITEPMRMKRFNDPEQEIRHNAERVLQRIEGYIRQHPRQWLMYYPVRPPDDPADSKQP
jgi:phosphatidylinositol dimannoside acyltransferase